MIEEVQNYFACLGGVELGSPNEARSGECLLVVMHPTILNPVPHETTLMKYCGIMSFSYNAVSLKSPHWIAALHAISKSVNLQKWTTPREISSVFVIDTNDRMEMAACICLPLPQATAIFALMQIQSNMQYIMSGWCPALPCPLSTAENQASHQIRENKNTKLLQTRSRPGHGYIKRFGCWWPGLSLLCETEAEQGQPRHYPPPPPLPPPPPPPRSDLILQIW